MLSQIGGVIEMVACMSALWRRSREGSLTKKSRGDILDRAIADFVMKLRSCIRRRYAGR